MASSLSMMARGSSIRSAISSPWSAQQLGQHLALTETYAADPGQVVESGMVEVDVLWRAAEPLGEEALEPDRHVAEADRAVALLQQRARHDADRVGEVDDPGVRRGMSAHGLGDVEHHRHRSQGLRQAAGAGGLLTDAPALERERLVAEPRGLPTDAQLDEHDGGVGRRQQTRSVVSRSDVFDAGVVEHPAGEAADDLEPLGVGVVQDELVEREGVACAARARTRAPGCTSNPAPTTASFIP